MSEESGAADLLLSEQVCFALYSASRAVTDIYRPLLAELKLTYPQYLVLLVLWEKDSRSVKQIGAELRLDYGTLSPLLKRLETRGLIERTRRPDDERTVVIGLTAEGDALRTKALSIPAAMACSLGLEDDARRELIDNLRQLTETATASATAGQE